jgi:hypothetical protein
MHHREVRRVSNEQAWWQATGIDPLSIAQKLWNVTRVTEGRIEEDDGRLPPTVTATDPPKSHRRGRRRRPNDQATGSERHLRNHMSGWYLRPCPFEKLLTDAMTVFFSARGAANFDAKTGVRGRISEGRGTCLWICDMGPGCDYFQLASRSMDLDCGVEFLSDF